MDALPAVPESEGGVLAAGDDEAVGVSRHLLTYCTLFLTFLDKVWYGALL